MIKICVPHWHSLNDIKEADEFLLESLKTIVGHSRTILEETLSFGSAVDSYELSQVLDEILIDNCDFIKTNKKYPGSISEITLNFNYDSLPFDTNKRSQFIRKISRAICRLLLRSMHSKDYDLNIETV